MADVPDVVDFWKRGSFRRGGGGTPRPLFGQVHEDAAVETFALNQLGPCRHAVAIGSGGCTAFALLTHAPELLSIVDINPAQSWLIELKRAAFLRLGYAELLTCVASDVRPFYQRLRDALTDEAREFWDAQGRLLAHGINHAGIAERNLRRAMIGFRAFVHGSPAIRRMLSHTDLEKQRTHFDGQWNTWRWRSLFHLALNRLTLRIAYAPPFLEALPKRFPSEMQEQVNDVFLRFPTATNPYLWQTFLGVYPSCGDAGLPIYLRRSHFETIREGLARTELISADLLAWLTRQPDRSIDFCALSNILEVTDPTYRTRLFSQLRRTARPGAVVCLRSIFSLIPAPREEASELDAALTRKATEIDRSLGCRNISIYRHGDRK